MVVKLFDEEIMVKDHDCSCCGQVPQKVEKYVNLYVNLTNKCNCNCSFCCNPNVNKVKKESFDFYKLYYIMHKIYDNGLKINRLSITGGEPTLCLDMLKDIVKEAKILDKEIFTIVNTNGSNLSKMSEDSEFFLNYLDSISLSMHSYNADDNAKIFGNSLLATVPDSIKESPLVNKIHISCNLIKGYIDSSDEIKKYLDNAAKLGIRDVGFVSLMPVNDFCKENFIDYADIDFESIEEMFLSKDYSYEDRCRCRNYLYLSNDGTPIQVYVRYYCDSSFCLSTLVYDGKNLKQGFKGKSII